MEGHHSCEKCGSMLCCKGKEWAILPLRFALGIMFLAQGIPKLMSLLSGSQNVPLFFSTIGIPLSGFFAWLVAILEVIGGLFLLVGFLTYWMSLLFAIEMVVIMMAAIVFRSPFNLTLFVYHLVFFGGLLTTMYGGSFMSVDSRCCCRHEHHEEKLEKAERAEKTEAPVAEKKPAKKKKK